MSATNTSTTATETPVAENPLDPSAATEQRIRKRAYHLWEADGRPEHRADEYWERARELEAIAGSPGAGQLPIDPPSRVDEAELQDNLGEFPDRVADQGERQPTPIPRRSRRESRSAA